MATYIRRKEQLITTPTVEKKRGRPKKEVKPAGTQPTTTDTNTTKRPKKEDKPKSVSDPFELSITSDEEEVPVPILEKKRGRPRKVVKEMKSGGSSTVYHDDDGNKDASVPIVGNRSSSRLRNRKGVKSEESSASIVTPSEQSTIANQKASIPVVEKRRGRPRKINLSSTVIPITPAISNVSSEDIHEDTNEDIHEGINGDINSDTIREIEVSKTEVTPTVEKRRGRPKKILKPKANDAASSIAKTTTAKVEQPTNGTNNDTLIERSTGDAIAIGRTTNDIATEQTTSNNTAIEQTTGNDNTTIEQAASNDIATEHTTINGTAFEQFATIPTTNETTNGGNIKKRGRPRKISKSGDDRTEPVVQQAEESVPKKRDHDQSKEDAQDSDEPSVGESTMEANNAIKTRGRPKKRQRIDE